MRISGNLVTGQLGAHAGGKGIPGCTHNCASCARNGRAIDHAISKGVLTDKVLNGLGSVASGIQLEGKPSPSVWKRMARDLHQNGTLVDGDVKRLRDFAKDVRSRRAEIKRSVLASMEEEVDPRLVRQLDKTDRFLLGYQAIERSLAEATARNTIRALVGCGFGPTNVVAAYAAAAQCSRRHIRELVEQLQRVERGESESVIAGNQVEPVHGEKLWQAKMHLLDEAIASAEAGHPVEIDAQYYELTNAEYLGKLARAAKAGCPLRINVDPTRVREGGEGQQSLNIDDSPKTFRSLIQLAGIPGADVGVSVYPVNQQLGGPTQLMHRKLLRVGEKVLLGGMNGNSGSGENVDAGWLIQGPAARALVEGFARDVDQSLGATNDELYSQQALIRVYSSKLTLTPHGLANLLDSLGTAPPFEHIPYQPSYSYLQRKAGEAGVNLQSLLAMTDEELQKALNSNSRQKLPISEEGKKLLAQEMRLALQATRHPKNVRSLKSIKLPDGKPVGQTAVAIGDRPLEREALLLHAINTAEKFIYVPAFVITRPVAQALAARRSQLHREGKEIDVRVIADAGLYPFGGTPNEYGVLPLEDAGIPVRWALLPNSSRFHDRKIHAKQILTDKMEFFGSTNLSRKGIHHNWEVSGVVFFDESDAASIQAREDSKKRFLKLWDHESFGVDTRFVAARWLAHDSAGSRWLAKTPAGERTAQMPHMRRRVMRTVLRHIQQFDGESADWLQRQLREAPAAVRAADLARQGMAPGYATLIAVEETLGTEKFYDELGRLPSIQKLNALARGA